MVDFIKILVPFFADMVKSAAGRRHDENHTLFKQQCRHLKPTAAYTN